MIKTENVKENLYVITNRRFPSDNYGNADYLNNWPMLYILENGDKVYIFVIDQRALMEQSSGHIYTDYVIGYVIGKKKGNTKQVEVKEVIQVSEEDFINDYRAIFDTEKMEQIMEVINKYRFENGTKNIIESLDF